MFAKFKAILIAVAITAVVVGSSTFIATWRYFDNSAKVTELQSKLDAKDRDLQAAKAFQTEAADAKAKLQKIETDYDQIGKEYADALKSVEGQAGNACNFVIGDSDAGWLRRAK